MGSLGFDDYKRKNKCISKVVFTGTLTINIWLLTTVLEEL